MTQEPMPEPAVAALADALRDHYRLEHELGRGGMATVYLARDLRHDRHVAIKVLRPELSAMLGEERFLREIQLTAKLQHPHILPVFDSGYSAETLWYAMPYVEGESLRGHLKREGRLPVAEALRLAREVADALEYAHRQGIVHRDVKPENVLLSQGHALVADFGIAKATGDGITPTLTEAGTVLGTAVYMSPEQATGGAVTPASDVYSLGCMVYEMLAGTLPFLAPTVQGTLARRFTEQVPHLRSQRPEVPPGVDAAVARALARTPDARYPSAAAFAEALSRSGGSSTLRWRRTALAGALLLAGVGAGVVLTRSSTGSRETPAGHTTLAVLPPRSVGDGADSAFAEGLGDEISTRLASLEGLGVIGRTSAGRYRTSTAPPTVIARELGADYVLVTTVRWDRAHEEPRIRVTSELVHATDGTTAWSNGYDAQPADVFEAQARVAAGIATAMGLRLGGAARARLVAASSRDPEALRYYFRGQDALRQVAVGYKDLDQEAIHAFTEATRRDSTFAAAYAGLADALLGLDLWSASASRLRAADSAVHMALGLDPELPEGMAARSRVLLARGEADSALAELERARRARPGSAEILRALGVALRERAGLDSSLRVLAEAARLDPQSAEALTEACRSAYAVSRDAARTYCARVVTLEPDLFVSYLAVGWGAYLDADQRRVDSVIGAYASRVGVRAAVAPFANIFAVYGSVVGAYDTTVLNMPPADVSQYNLFLARALVRRAHGGAPAAVRADLDSAAARFEARLLARDTLGAYDVGGAEALLGLTRAIQGRRAEAIAITRSVLGRHPVAPTWYARTQLHAIGAITYMLAGADTAALDELEQQLREPWLISRARLRSDPLWNPLRGHPRFQRLLADGA